MSSQSESRDMTSLGLQTNRLGIALLLIIIYLFYLSIFGTQLQGKYESSTWVDYLQTRPQAFNMKVNLP